MSNPDHGSRGVEWRAFTYGRAPGRRPVVTVFTVNAKKPKQNNSELKGNMR